jgi:hypothetical protein
MEQGHEKFVSIEYDKWNNYYKPLEQTNKQLLSELQAERRNQEATIGIHIDNYERGDFLKNVLMFKISYVHGGEKAMTLLKDFDFRAYITNLINGNSYGDPRYYGRYGDNYSKKIVIFEDDLISKRNELQQLKDECIEAENKIKQAKVDLENKKQQIKKEAKESLPRWVRWLAKVKV